jgi:hypothetical protein
VRRLEFPPLALLAWQMMCDADVPPDGGTLKHWLWTLCFLKVCAKQGPRCALCGGSDPKTVSKWTWAFIGAWIMLEGDVVSLQDCTYSMLVYNILTSTFLLYWIIWENRKKGDKCNDCLVSVDGVDFKIAEHGPAFSSHTFAKKSGLRYEIALCILTGGIMWLNGPFACGKNPDITIFQKMLMSFLDDFERVEADDGYIGEHPQHVKCPKGFANPEEPKFMQSRVRSRQETVNKRFKD